MAEKGTKGWMPSLSFRSRELQRAIALDDSDGSEGAERDDDSGGGEARALTS